MFLCDEFVGVTQLEGAVVVRFRQNGLGRDVPLQPHAAVDLVMALVGELARMGYIRMRMLWKICRAIDQAHPEGGA